MTQNFFNEGSLADTSLPLLQTSVQANAHSAGPATATNSAGATLFYSEGDDFGFEVPSLGGSLDADTWSDGLALWNGSLDIDTTYVTPRPTIGISSRFAYVLPGSWFVFANNASTFSAFVTGLQTPLGGLPPLGIGVYQGNAFEMIFMAAGVANIWGDATLNVNFGSGTISGALTNMWGFNGTFDGYSNDVTISASIQAGANSFSGASTAGPPKTSAVSISNAATGTIAGRFYGPNAEELGAVWTLSDGTNAAIGTIGATTAPPFTVGAPAAPSRGSSPAPTQTASAGGPTFDGTGPYQSNVTFPLTATTLDYTASGLSAAAGNQSASAIVKTSSANPSVLELVIPGVNIDTTITIPGNLGLGEYIEASANGYGYGVIDALSYVAFGVWGQTDAPLYRPGSVTAFAFGYETPVSAMPTTGTADYSGTGTVRGRVFIPFENTYPLWTDVTGNAAFSVNFATGKVNGVLSGTTASDWDYGSTPWNDVSITGDIAAGTSRFSGTTAATTAPNNSFALKGSATGSINGAFYGPAAQNLGAVWTLSDGTASAIGVVGATKQ